MESVFQKQVTNRTSLRIGDTVELGEVNFGKRDGPFLKVKQIFYNKSTGRTRLRGWKMTRTRNVGGLLTFRLNELCLLAEHANPAVTDTNEITNAAMHSVDLETEVYFENGEPVKRELFITNQPFPALSLHEQIGWDPTDPNAPELKQIMARTSQLVCRHGYVTYKRTRNGVFSNHAAMMNIPASFADPLCAVPDWQLHREYRGLPTADAERYSFGDCFCGAGGVSEGAAAAGLEVAFAFERDSNACSTFGLNHPNTTIWQADQEHFLVLLDNMKVDVLHISPPCQGYSRMNWRARSGRDDYTSRGAKKTDEDQAASFAVEQLIKQCKPRVVTMEQTDGIADNTMVGFLCAVVCQFTDQGYSVRWRISDLAEYGNPHRRKRLIVIASCPGSVLPSFPPATHGPGTGNPLNTIDDCIGAITEYHENHNPDFSHIGPDHLISSGDELLRHCIMTNGTIDLHPTGRRFTVRELAALQTLPLTYRFPHNLTDKEMTKQIGNMVPARFAETLMRSIIEYLRKEDQQTATDVALAKEFGDFPEEVVTGTHDHQGDTHMGSSNDNPIIINDDDSYDSDATLGR